MKGKLKLDRASSRCVLKNRSSSFLFQILFPFLLFICERMRRERWRAPLWWALRPSTANICSLSLDRSHIKEKEMGFCLKKRKERKEAFD